MRVDQRVKLRVMLVVTGARKWWRELGKETKQILGLAAGAFVSVMACWLVGFWGGTEAAAGIVAGASAAFAVPAFYRAVLVALRPRTNEDRRRAALAEKAVAKALTETKGNAGEWT